MLLVTPVISSLRQNYPQAQIDVLLYQETQEMLASNPELSTLFAIDRQWKKQGARAHLGHELALLRRLKAQRYDLVVNLADQWRSAILTRLTGARIRLGFDFPKRRGFLWRHCHTQLVPVDNHAHLHTVEQNLSLLAPLNHAATETRVRAERAMNTRLEGGCQVPIGSYAELDGDSLWLRALVGAPDGSQMVRGERRGPAAEAERMGVELAEELLARGAREILREVYQGNPPA